MNKLIIITGWLGFSLIGYAYEGPAPLKNIKVHPSVSFDAPTSLYRYSYSISNPSMNDGQIFSFDLFISKDPEKDTDLPNEGFKHCGRFHKHSSENNLKKFPMVPVGSDAPKGWSCGYAGLKGYTEGSYGFGAIDDPYVIQPGKTLGGFVVTSAGLPAMRQILIEPSIDFDRLPSDYEENSDKITALEDKVKWIGKTIGPKAPPKVFDGANFIAYLITLVNQSRAQGWIDNDGITNSLTVKLNTAQSKISAGDTKTAKNVLGAFMNDVQAQNGKHLSAEAYALLYFNGKYLADHL